VSFFQPIVHLAANNQFSRRFVWGQKGVACECWQNEYLFENQGKKPLNAVRFAAKRKLKCSKMRDKKHKHTQQLHKQHLCKP